MAMAQWPQQCLMSTQAHMSEWGGRARGEAEPSREAEPGGEAEMRGAGGRQSPVGSRRRPGREAERRDHEEKMDAEGYLAFARFV